TYRLRGREEFSGFADGNGQNRAAARQCGRDSSIASSRAADGRMFHPRENGSEEVPTALRLDEETPAAPPLVLCWSEPDRPLPVRAVRAPARPRARIPGQNGASGLTTGPAGEPFDFCGHVQRLCEDIVYRCANLRHIH